MAVAAGILLLGASLARAEDPPKPAEPASPPKTWSDATEFSYVQTSGNTETSTLGFKTDLTGKWEKSMFGLKAGAVRVDSTTFTRFATGTLANPDEHTDRDSALTAESYYLTGRYDRRLTQKVTWFAGGGWDRNTFAGIQNRYTGGGGISNVWRDSERTKFRTSYAATITRQEDVVDNPDVEDTFGGLFVSLNYTRKFGAATTYGNDTAFNENLKDTSDWRVDMTNWIAVTMSRRLALKASLQWLYDNSPALEAITVYDLYPTDPLATALGTTLVPLEKFDSVFTTSLVVNF
jgi:putative salt-induced outer membrane protein YdiY